MTGTIERATGEAVERLVELMRQFYAEEGYPFDETRTRPALAELMADEALGAVWAFREGEAVVGYLVVTCGFSLEFGGRDAFVDELFVEREHRGRGLGAEALAEAERFCRSRGISALHLEVEHVNTRAKALYGAKGYAEHTRHLMTKRLDGPR